MKCLISCIQFIALVPLALVLWTICTCACGKPFPKIVPMAKLDIWTKLFQGEVSWLTLASLFLNKKKSSNLFQVCTNKKNSQYQPLSNFQNKNQGHRLTEDFQNFPHQHMEKQIQIFKCIFAILSFWNNDRWNSFYKSESIQFTASWMLF